MDNQTMNIHTHTKLINELPFYWILKSNAIFNIISDSTSSAAITIQEQQQQCAKRRNKNSRDAPSKSFHDKSF
jgi:hypothetical protein